MAQPLTQPAAKKNSGEKSANAAVYRAGDKPPSLFSRSLSMPQLPRFVGLKDLVVFTRTMSTMIDAGLPLVSALDLLANQSENPRMSQALRHVKSEVEQGKTFHFALASEPRVFNHLFCSLISAGEKGGILDVMFRRLAVYLEKNAKLLRQLRGALVYPSAIVVVGMLVMGIMLTRVLPEFEKMFKSLGAGALPAPTRFVLAISHGVSRNIGWVLLAILGTIVGFVVAYRQPKGRLWIDRALLRLPVLGNVIRKIAVARFTRTLGTLLNSGVPVLDALEIVAQASGNKVIENAIMHVRAQVMQGQTIAAPLLATKVFPPLVGHMLSVGERTGALDEMLQKIADFYEEEVDAAVAAMTALLEPVILVVLGGAVGGMLIAMYLPIFEVAGAVK